MPIGTVPRLFTFTLLLLSLTASARGEQLTIERLFADPALAGTTSRALAFAPDGSRVTFLRPRQDDFQRFDLWEYHLADRELRLLVDSRLLAGDEEALSDEEKARRERQRLYGRGIMEYVWSEDSSALLFPLAGDVYRVPLDTGEVERLTESEGFETDVRSSPGGRFVSYIRDQDIFVFDLEAGEEIQLTFDGEGAVKNGMAEFVAQEEMKRFTGYWWSPDGRHIAFLQVDESPVDVVQRSEIYADRTAVIEQRYPAAGRPNAALRLGVIDVADGSRRWLHTGEVEDFYLPRVDWARDDLLTYQWQSRDQQLLELRAVDLASGETRLLLREASETWINLHDDLQFLDDGDHFVWSSERDGHRHLYLYSVTEGLQSQLTAGDWVVDALAAVDEARGLVYFSGRYHGPTERHLYRVPLKAGSPATPERITRRPGFHAITFADDAQSYLDTYSRATTPPQVSLHAASGERVVWIEENAVTDGHPLAPYRSALVQPDFGTLTAPEGHTLYYRMYLPADFDPALRYPVVQYVYGGPGSQVVKDAWHGLFHQYLAQQGFLVFSVDNRGSEGRGKAFEDPIYTRMGHPEVEDQVAGVTFLRSLPYVDPQRIAIYGHSYGGYMALMSLMQAGDYFSAGVAGAPVTDWLLYDTHYTERYMGLPAARGEAYTASSVFPYVDRLRDPLLLYHGMADDNVLFSNSTRLMTALQDAGKQFELMTYPGKKHGIRGKSTQAHLHNLIADFLRRHIGDAREE
jgi:dipeptidyl-peptidase-4